MKPHTSFNNTFYKLLNPRSRKTGEALFRIAAPCFLDLLSVFSQPCCFFVLTSLFSGVVGVDD